MSQITYNDISLPYPFTSSFRQEAVYDDFSHTDMCLVKYDIQVQCLIGVDYLALLCPEFASSDVSNAAGVMKVVRQKLMTPRKELTLYLDDENLIPSSQEGQRGDLDAKNGPMPQRCDILAVTASTFILSYHITAHYWEKYETDGSRSLDVNTNLAAGTVLYNRWTETVEIDDRDMSRRVREGKFMIRSNNVGGFLADQLRVQMATISLPKGFVREQQRYTQSPDGLGLSYYIVDREAFKLPPPVAFKARGTYTESTTALGAIRYGEVRLHLEGSKESRQHKLLEQAISIAASKLYIQGAKAGTSGNSVLKFALLEFAVIHVDMYENSVDIQIKCKLTAKRIKFQGMPFTGVMTFTPQSDGFPSHAPPYTARGTASLLLQAAAYNNPDLNFSLGIGQTTTTTNPLVTDGDARVQVPGIIPGQGGKKG